jgi:xylose isomerase
MKKYQEISKIKFEGTGSSNPFAFRHYDADALVMGKPMRDHLKFAMSYWHTINAGGADMSAARRSTKPSVRAIRWPNTRPRPILPSNSWTSWASATTASML